MKAETLYLDIETTPLGVWSWMPYGKNWRMIELLVPWSILCVAAKWEGKKTEIYSIWDYKNFKPLVERYEDGSILLRKPNDKELVKTIHGLYDEAHIIIGHNVKAFDTKKIVSRFLAHKLPPPSPYTQIDTLTEHRKIAAPTSHKLDDLVQSYGLGRKLPHEGFPLWMGAMEGKQSAINKMERYCKRDVDVGNKLYKYLGPWMENHPSLNVFTGQPMACPFCLKEGTIIKRGPKKLAGGKRRQMYHCAPNRKGCGKYPKGELIPQDEKIILR